MNSNFFNIIMLAISLYVLYSGIVGKGRLYQADNIKEDCKDKFVPTLRKMFLALGVVMLLMSAANFATTAFFTQKEQIFVFSETYTAPDGTAYAVGDQIALTKAEEYLAAEPQPESANTSGGMCAMGGTSYGEDSIANKGTGEAIFEPRFPDMYSDGFEQADYDAFNKTFRIASGVLMGLSVLILIVLFVMINKMTDKQKRQEQRTNAQRNVSAMPSDAFNFDEEASPAADAQQDAPTDDGQQ